MLDNLTVAEDGTLILLEDVGGNARSGKVWSYDPKTDQLSELGQHDPAGTVNLAADHLARCG